MTAANLDAMTPLPRTIVERARILARGLEAAAGPAPDGQVVDHHETSLLAEGREFLRRALEETLRGRVEALEKKGRPDLSLRRHAPQHGAIVAVDDDRTGPGAPELD